MWIHIDESKFEKRGAEYIQERIQHYKDDESEVEGKFQAAAKEASTEGELEVDDAAVVSISDEGAYVMCWMWVSNEEAGIETDETEQA